jgi:hypothetical protein
MPRPPKWAGWLGPPAALLLLSLASWAIPPADREGPAVAADAQRIQIPSPRLFGSTPGVARAEPLPPADASGGVAAARRKWISAAAHDGLPGTPSPQSGYRGPRAACEHSGSDLCYDLADRRIVYRPARRYMPQLDGLTAESVSLRRDGVRLRYSFR